MEEGEANKPPMDNVDGIMEAYNIFDYEFRRNVSFIDYYDAKIRAAPRKERQMQHDKYLKGEKDNPSLF